MSRPRKRQPVTAPAKVSVWADAICDVIEKKDRRELVDMLRHYDGKGANEITPDVAEFLAWLLDDEMRKTLKSRPPLPMKFKQLHRVIRDPMFDTLVDFKQAEVAWRRNNEGRDFPYQAMIDRIGGDENANALDNKLKRGPKSGKKVLP